MSSLVGTREHSTDIKTATITQFLTKLASFPTDNLKSSFTSLSKDMQNSITATMPNIIAEIIAGTNRSLMLSIMLNRYNSKFIANPFGAPSRGADGDEIVSTNILFMSSGYLGYRSLHMVMKKNIDLNHHIQFN